MNPSDLDDDALEGLLRAAAPEPLLEDGFVARTMTAVDQAARSESAPRRATPAAPIAIARALAAEQRRHEAQARLWRWATAGVAAGFLLMLVAVLVSPSDGTIAAPPPLQWYPLSVLLAVGAVWVAWRELRSN
jgi:hypothetical protein